MTHNCQNQSSHNWQLSYVRRHYKSGNKRTKSKNDSMKIGRINTKIQIFEDVLMYCNRIIKFVSITILMNLMIVLSKSSSNTFLAFVGSSNILARLYYF